jgi:anti-sigma regulatory factor (Ser/Thr protein kinase)
MASTQEGDPVQVGEATLACAPEAAVAARTIVSRWLEGPAHAAFHDDACLLVSELVANSVLHADQPSGAPLRIRSVAADDVVRVEVEDRGQGAVRRRAADPKKGGFGLELLDLIAARWGVNQDHGTRVWFELAARGPVV